MNILVTGANGQLGSCIRNAAPRTADNYIFTDVAELDISDADAVEKMVADNNVDVIVNCAAFTNVDAAEDAAELAEKLNSDAAGILARAARNNDAFLIHVSTDYVFGGNAGNTPRAEDEPANPTGVYGLTKLHGEQAIADAKTDAIILRTAWLYSEYGKNFVKTMLSLTSSKPQLNVVFDQCGTPTYAQDLADAIVEIISSRRMHGYEGIYHYSNEGVCSWYDFTRIIADLAGNNACKVLPCHSDEFPSKVVRPSYSVLDKTKFKNTFNMEIPFWVDSLKTCINNLKNEA